MRSAASPSSRRRFRCAAVRRHASPWLRRTPRLQRLPVGLRRGLLGALRAAGQPEESSPARRSRPQLSVHGAVLRGAVDGFGRRRERPGMWIDAHVHLDAPAFDADRDGVVARAASAGVALMVSAGTTVDGSRRALALADRYSSVVAAVGIHPEAAGNVTQADFAVLATLARHPRVVAIGEVGLDYYRDHAPRCLQIEVFRSQIRLAREVGLPLVVHDREAHEDVERILRDEGAARVVLHCFSGTPEMARLQSPKERDP